MISVREPRGSSAVTNNIAHSKMLVLLFLGVVVK